eukprot:gnl/TRDRNA2_/TRDRNA2_182004_c0_seq1.p1 gnl/TRDRNA2_/TRDRNA2_182004_c0~~gnl/TRDRNA2_/TRDRNA2_182004_c0_seq1.p1  ORF type:complete len:525 (+),score=126.63 gnl/TRDRNA2_/TRDRNA2_182004_c0_seq1:63-1637(+)
MSIMEQTPRLKLPPENVAMPKLMPCVNKKVQQIIAAHTSTMSTSTIDSTATVPVLAQIDSTAPRTARTHDISHLFDKATFLAPVTPPSLIEVKDHVYEATFLPKDASSVYNELDGLWCTKIFPSDTPSSRTDAILLDAWITRALEQHQQTGDDKGEDLVNAVENLVPILSVALHEIVRQIGHYCVERGVVLEKIWKTYVELFHRVLKEMQISLGMHKQKTAEVQQVLSAAREDLSRLRKSHPEQMQRVIAELEGEFTARQKEVEEDLKRKEQENEELKNELRQHHSALEIWYPSFSLYQNSYIKASIPQYTSSERGPRKSVVGNRATIVNLAGTRGSLSSAHLSGSVAELPTEALQEASKEKDGMTPRKAASTSPEVAIAEDFKRLLAVLAPEKRKTIGRELSNVLTSSSSISGGIDPKAKKRTTRRSSKEGEGGAGSEEALALATLQSKVSAQEERIRELREQILDLEQQLETAIAAEEKSFDAQETGKKSGDGSPKGPKSPKSPQRSSTLRFGEAQVEEMPA